MAIVIPCVLYFYIDAIIGEGFCDALRPFDDDNGVWFAKELIPADRLQVIEAGEAVSVYVDEGRGLRG